MAGPFDPGDRGLDPLEGVAERRDELSTACRRWSSSPRATACCWAIRVPARSRNDRAFWSSAVAGHRGERLGQPGLGLVEAPRGLELGGEAGRRGRGRPPSRDAAKDQARAAPTSNPMVAARKISMPPILEGGSDSIVDVAGPPVLRPMLAGIVGVPSDVAERMVEPKWDGVRVIATVTGGRVRLASRNGNDVTGAYPELDPPPDACVAAVLDGEVVALDEDGHTSFGLLQRRMHVRQPVARPLAEVPVPHAVFDLLWSDGELLVGQPQTRAPAPPRRPRPRYWPVGHLAGAGCGGGPTSTMRPGPRASRASCSSVPTPSTSRGGAARPGPRSNACAAASSSSADGWRASARGRRVAGPGRVGGRAAGRCASWGWSDRASR